VLEYGQFSIFMLERLKKVLPPYFVEKFEETDRRQVDQLPDGIRCAFIHGTKEEFIQALVDIRTRERLQRKILLGQAAMELICEMRTYSQGE